jgi:hypothetical protein
VNTGGSRTKGLLGVLVVLAALGWWMRGSDQPEPFVTGTQQPGSGSVDAEGDRARPARPPSGQQAVSSTEPRDLDVAALDRIPSGYRLGRDPWHFVEPPPPPPPPPPRPPGAADLRAAREAAEAAERARLAAEEAARIEAAKPKPPEFTYSCAGYLSQTGRRIFILVSQDGRQVINVEQGDVIAGKFIVARAGLESIEIKFVGFPEWPAKVLPVPVGR